MVKHWLVQKYLDRVGEGFCLDKWNSSTLHLGTGMEHGCHHPAPVKIDPEELSSCSALTNHTHKLSVRQQMLDGGKPAECNYCWRSKGLQDRVIHSGKGYNLRNRNITGLHSIPKYLEVSFGNVCNLGCAYCGPSFSSVWQQDIEQHGSYPNEYNKYYVAPIPNNKNNPYIDAFWDWWPELRVHLEQLRITGGEPLMSKHTYTVLQQAENIKITVNTNLAVNRTLLDKFITAAKRVKNLTISVSGESTGARAEYARLGLDYKLFLDNLTYIHKHLPKAKIQIMSTYNVLCVTTFTDFLKDVKNIVPNVMLSVTRLQNPDFMHHTLLDTAHKEQSLDYIKCNFNREAYKRFENIIADEPIVDQSLDRLLEFSKQFDKRKGTNFVDTFPEFSAPPRSASSIYKEIQK